MKKIGLILTSKSTKVDWCLDIHYKNSPCLQMIITLPIHLGIGQNYHQKRWNVKSFPTICISKKYDTSWVLNAQKHIVHLGVGFRWKFVVKETKATFFCLVTMGHTNSQLPTLFKKIWKWPIVIPVVKNWFGFFCEHLNLDENWRQGKYYKITNVNQVKYHKMWATLNSIPHEFPTH